MRGKNIVQPIAHHAYGSDGSILQSLHNVYGRHMNYLYHKIYITWWLISYASWNSYKCTADAIQGHRLIKLISQ